MDLKILDKYILTQFTRNFLFGIICFIAIFILVDLFENLDKFLDKNLGFIFIVRYYFYFIPEILKLITPVGMLLATLFTMSKFNNFSELIAINSSGISLYRFSVPIFLFGVLITLLSLYFNGWVVPKTNSQKFSLERAYMDKNKLPGIILNLHVEDSNNQILSIGSYNETDRIASNASLQVFDKKNLSHLLYRFDIRSMVWDSLKQEWMLIKVSERKFDSLLTEDFLIKDTVYASQIPELNKIYLSPTKIINSQLKPDELLISDLKDFIETMEESGQNVSKAKVDYYSKISFPFANILVILFGISVSSTRQKGGAAIQFGISIFITFIYLGFIKISQTFGYSGDINPILTAWLANITFFLFAVLNMFRLKLFWK